MSATHIRFLPKPPELHLPPPESPAESHYTPFSQLHSPRIQRSKSSSSPRSGKSDSDSPTLRPSPSISTLRSRPPSVIGPRPSSSLGFRSSIHSMGVGFMSTAPPTKLKVADMRDASPGGSIPDSKPTKSKHSRDASRESTEFGGIVEVKGERPSTHSRFKFSLLKKKRSLTSLLTVTPPHAISNDSTSISPAPSTSHSHSASPAAAAPLDDPQTPNSIGIPPSSPGFNIMFPKLSESPAAELPPILTEKAKGKRPASDEQVAIAPPPPEEAEQKKKGRFIHRKQWKHRHGMRLHPYQGEVPYMVAYAPMLLESERAAHRLLDVILEGGVSFLDHGSGYPSACPGPPSSSSCRPNSVRAPPKTVLDLGCGEGTWARAAANMWQESHVTGFDLVQLWRESAEVHPNVTFVQGDFVEHPLPFADNSFDYVRMANLGLAIPIDRWDYVLCQAKRVLTVGGRLELLEDEMIFGYGHDVADPMYDKEDTPKQSACDEDEAVSMPLERNGHLQQVPEEDETSSDQGDFDAQGVVLENGDKKPTPDSVSEYCETLVADDADSVSLAHSANRASDSGSIRSVSLDMNSTTTWGKNAACSSQLEHAFKDMLLRHYGVLPSAKFLEDGVRFAFGSANVEAMRSVHLKLAAKDPALSESEEDNAEEKRKNGDAKKPWLLSMVGDTKKDHEKTERKAEKEREKAVVVSLLAELKLASDVLISKNAANHEVQLRPNSKVVASTDTVNPKSAGMLGLNYSSLVGLVRSASHSSSKRHSAPVPHSTKVQSAGLVVWPSKFFPMTATELEMHACKHIHTLIACKVALIEYAECFLNSAGEPEVSARDIEDALWEYECFRRSRFNWPADVPESHFDVDDLEVEPTTTPKIAHLPQRTTPTEPSSLQAPARNSSGSSSSSSTAWTPYGPNELTHVRTVRVFEAYKTAPDSPDSS